MEWKTLMCGARRKPSTGEPKPPSFSGSRTEFERDHDRILFSTPFRRLIDKTQVFPLEKKYDTVRRRLTHSMEVGNLARSIGVNLAFNHADIFPPEVHAARNIPAILAAVGLAHDLGNPPFGHEGEEAIRDWFKNRNETDKSIFAGLTPEQQDDFLVFEGNAQTFRLITKLQLLNDNYGLNLTIGTLSALMKYVVGASRSKATTKDDGKRKPALKKCGFFCSEKSVALDVQTQTGTGENRNPLTYIMEACDDIAYSILDAEDAAKKGLVSFADLMAHLAKCSSDLAKSVVKKAKDRHAEFRQVEMSPHELDDVSMQMFRVAAVEETVNAATKAFIENYPVMLKGEFEGDLLQKSDAKEFSGELKEFDKAFAYRNKDVLGIELQGHIVIQGLMDMLYDAITERKGGSRAKVDRGSPFANYAYGRISENYRRIFEKNADGLPLGYRELQLLTDMVSGMTDSFAVEFYKELKGRKNGP